ncbi:MAG: beta galactosidase jelly roll domain-containing protein, partial [Draconibacterium sp.]|nr:beta galactosidase jelly roll domain-containing protein [Draconibacterium sp.]
MRKFYSLLKNMFIIIAGISIISACTQTDKPVSFRTENISSGWKMQSSEKLTGIDEALISKNDYNVESWLEAVVPGTVLGAMATHGVIEDPYFGINMQSINPDDFKKPWWFRTTFNVSANDLSKMISLRFNGINYRADLWINGKKVVGKDEFAHTYRMHTFNIDDYVVEGKNTMALKMWQHADGEYSIGFVDWNPLPRDRNLGIYREVFLEVNEGVKITSPFIYSKVNTKTLNEADLFFQAEIENKTSEVVEGTIRVDYEIGVVEKKITLTANEIYSCRLSPEEFAQLSVKDIKLWWPNGMGEPNLYNMKVEFIADGKVLSNSEKKYGIREITSKLNEDKHRYFEINGKFVLIKSGGWVDDVLLQDTKEYVEAQMKYIRHMNMNSIRCEGFWGKTEMLYDLCDEYGILVMIGWSCHWEWDEYLL